MQNTHTHTHNRIPKIKIFKTNIYVGYTNNDNNNKKHKAYN